MDTQGAIGSCLSYMIKVLPTSVGSSCTPPGSQLILNTSNPKNSWLQIISLTSDIIVSMKERMFQRYKTFPATIMFSPLKSRAVNQRVPCSAEEK